VEKLLLLTNKTIIAIKSQLKAVMLSIDKNECTHILVDCGLLAIFAKLLIGNKYMAVGCINPNTDIDTF